MGFFKDSREATEGFSAEDLADVRIAALKYKYTPAVSAVRRAASQRDRERQEWAIAKRVPASAVEDIARADAVVANNNWMRAAAIITRRNAYHTLHAYRSRQKFLARLSRAWHGMPIAGKALTVILAYVTVLPAAVLTVLVVDAMVKRLEVPKLMRDMRTPILPERKPVPLPEAPAYRLSYR